MSTLSKKLKNLKDYRSTVEPKVKDEIIVEYAPLVKYIAQKIASRLPSNIELDDLISSGAIGLMDAIDKYDPTRDNKFKTYAEFRIRGAILDELRAQDWIPRSVREKAKLIDRTYMKLEREMGRLPKDEEIAKAIKTYLAFSKKTGVKSAGLDIDTLRAFLLEDIELPIRFNKDIAFSESFASSVVSA